MKNGCYKDGYVVGLEYPLPTDLSDYYMGGLTATVGCNQLYCRRCDVPVRCVSGLDLRPSIDRAKLLKQHYNVQLGPGLSESTAYSKILYDVPDVSASPLVQPSSSCRLYLCRCEWWSEASSNYVELDADPYPSDPRLPWFCAGHPIVTLPHDFDGAHADNEQDLVELCRRTFHGWTPPEVQPTDRRGAIWAMRLHGRLAGTPWQERVAVAAASYLDDSDPQTRARAIQFFDSLQVTVGMERGVELLEKQRALYIDVPDQITSYSDNKTLEDSLFSAILPLARQPGRARNLVRSQVLTPGKGRRLLYSILASFDTEWFVAHAEEMAHATPDHCKDLVANLANVPSSFDTREIVEKLKPLLPKKKERRR